MEETQGFLYLGLSNWTICSLSQDAYSRAVLGTFKLDHLQTGKMILSQKISIGLIFILGEYNSLLPQRVEMRQRDTPKNG